MCGEKKPVGDFATYNRARGGRYPYCKPCSVQRARDWRTKNLERAKKADRAYKLSTKYGMTVEEYDALAARQEGRCGICRTTPSEALVVDHDHDSGEVRGLLCDKCNRGLGHFGDNPELLERAAVYLQ